MEKQAVRRLRADAKDTHVDRAALAFHLCTQQKRLPNVANAAKVAWG